MPRNKRNYRRKKKNHNAGNIFSSSPGPHIFQTLISRIRSDEGLKLPFLKTLYYILNQLSFKETINLSDEEVYVCGYTVKLGEICSLSNVLFEECNSRFNQLFFALDRAQGLLGLNFPGNIEEVTLLLRCCMVHLTLFLPVFDHDVLIQNGKVLLLILNRLISVEVSWGNEKTKTYASFPKLVPHREETHIMEGSTVSQSLTGSSNPFQKVVCPLLEVFADELLMHKTLQEFFLLIDSASSPSKMIFTSHLADGDIGTALEVIASHFIISFASEQAFEDFLNRLVWQDNNVYQIPEMSLTASLSLLQNPIMWSAPKNFQAYLILLVSEAIGIGPCTKYLKPENTFMNYVTAFERSVVLYNRYMSNLDVVGHPVGNISLAAKSSMLGSCQLTYESYFNPVTRNKVNHVVTKLNDYWDSYINSRSLRAKSDMVEASMAYVKESLYLFDKKFKDKILSILSSIVNESSSGETLLCGERRSPEETYLLASILKLMSSSILQVIWCLRFSSSSDCLKTVQDVLLHEGCDFVAHLVGGFQLYNFDLPIQKFVMEMMKAHPTRHKESKWMLLHCVGLLSSSFVSGLDFLVKDCIFTIMSLFSLFVFEEGDLDALSVPLNSGLDSVSLKPSAKFRKALQIQRTSNQIASKYRKIQNLHLRKSSGSSLNERNNQELTGVLENAFVRNEMKSSTSTKEELGEVCNGEAFLKCILDSSTRSSDIDDLADFIECTPGKDYSAWWNNRKRFRIWKSERTAVNWCDKWNNKSKSRRRRR